MCEFLASDERRLMHESLRRWMSVARDLADILHDAGFSDSADEMRAFDVLCRYRALEGLE